MFRRLFSKWKWIGVFTSLLLCVSVAVAWHVQNGCTDGFGPQSIFMNSSFDSRWEFDEGSALTTSELDQIFPQRYQYIAKGTQSYVLASEDGQYAIKFFKGKHLHISPWVRRLAQVPFLSGIFREKIQRREARKCALFHGCSVAYRVIPQETGLVYLHLNPTDISDHPTLQIIDKLGRLYEINLATASFVVQRLGRSALEQLKVWRDAQEHRQAREGLAALFTHLVERSAKGILDTDSNYGHNLGFVEGSVVTLDVGGLVEDDLIKNPVESKRRIVTNMAQVRYWLSTEYPELLPDYDRQVALLNSNAI